MLTVTAPAKINLTLEVLGKRPDGYHEIRTILQTVTLADQFSFTLGESTFFECAHEEWRAEQSLLPRAVALLRETTGYAGGATVRVEKNIPLTSGLGGDSSDAATVLRALNELWHLGLSRKKLAELAARLGSDVPF
ncbi:MAG: 4-(cytidine 5'-diphospho)-2-C-methyl-D-erythritol kinase, partial [Chloroflexota bacterium]